MATKPTFKPSNRKLAGAKRLLSENSLPLTPESLLNCLEGRGLVVRKTYVSTTGTGEIKEFLAISDDWLHIGANLGNHFHPFKTEPRFYSDSFQSVYRLACEFALEKANEIK